MKFFNFRANPTTLITLVCRAIHTDLLAVTFIGKKLLLGSVCIVGDNRICRSQNMPR